MKVASNIMNQYGGLSWYFAEVGRKIRFRSPFKGPMYATVLALGPNNGIHLQLEDGTDYWTTTWNLTLEEVSDV